ERYPRPGNIPGDEPGSKNWWDHYYHHFAWPYAKAHSLAGFVYMNEAVNVNKIATKSSTGKPGPILANPDIMGKAVTAYATAAAWFPPDDPERSYSMLHA